MPCVLSRVGETRAHFAAFGVDQRNRLDDLFAGRFRRRAVLRVAVAVNVTGWCLRGNVLLRGREGEVKREAEGKKERGREERNGVGVRGRLKEECRRDW